MFPDAKLTGNLTSLVVAFVIVTMVDCVYNARIKNDVSCERVYGVGKYLVLFDPAFGVVTVDCDPTVGEAVGWMK